MKNDYSIFDSAKCKSKPPAHACMLMCVDVCWCMSMYVDVCWCMLMYVDMQSYAVCNLSVWFGWDREACLLDLDLWSSHWVCYCRSWGKPHPISLIIQLILPGLGVILQVVLGSSHDWPRLSLFIFGCVALEFISKAVLWVCGLTHWMGWGRCLMCSFLNGRDLRETKPGILAKAKVQPVQS